MQWYLGIILVVLGVLLYVLYDRGYLPVKSMSAIHFIGNMGAGTNKASAAFGSANGQIRRVLRFKESKSYEFTFKERSAKARYRPMCWKAIRSLNWSWITIAPPESYTQ